MDPRTLELLRALQAEEHTAAALDHILEQFREQRAVLSAADDRATLNELCELLEAWADGATADLASLALQEAALSIEEDLEQPLRAIAVLERVLDLEPTTDSLAQLARLYTQRNGEGDRGQAAELYSALGETLGDEGRPWLERALNLVPTHDAALEALESIIAEGERPKALRERWAAYLENGGDAKAEAEGRPDAVKSGERRRLELSRAYAAEGSFRDALVFIAPLAERGHTEAARLQEAYLANLEGAVAPTSRGKKADSLPPPKHARPARSGGTMVGFRLDQYHEALRKETEEERGSEPEPEAPAAESARASDEPRTDEPSEDSVVRAMPRDAAKDAVSAAVSMAAKEAAQAVTANGDDAPASEEAAAPAVRRSLPPPNPEVVRASQPAPRRSGSGQVAASVASAPSPAPSPKPQRHLAAVSAPQAAPMAKAATLLAAAPAALGAPAVSLPMAATEMALPQPVAQAAALPEANPFAAALPAMAAPPVAASAAFDDDALPSSKRKASRPLWPFAAGGLVAIALGAFAMMGGDETAETAKASPTTTTASAATAAPPPSATTTTTTVAAAPTPPPAAAPTPPPAAAPVVAEAPKKVVREKAIGTVKTVAKEIRVRGGKITPTKVLASFEGSLTKIEHCYEEVLEDNPKVSGRATLGFTIAKTGKVSAAKLTKSTLKNAALERCTLSAVKEERFAKVKKPAQVTMPLAFSR